MRRKVSTDKREDVFVRDGGEVCLLRAASNL